KDSAGAVIPLGSGYTAAMKIKDAIGGTEIASLTNGSGITLASVFPNINIKIAHTATAGYDFDDAVYDFELTHTSASTRSRIMEGKVTLSKCDSMTTQINKVSVTESINSVQVSEVTKKVTITETNTTVSISSPYSKVVLVTGNNYQTFTDGSNVAAPDTTSDEFTFVGTAPITTTVSVDNDNVTVAATLDTDLSSVSGSDDTLASAKAIKTYVDAQDANIASDTLAFTNKTFDVEATGNSISNIDVADLKSGVLDTNISSVSGSDDTLPSAKATKTYIDGAAS
ncbi:uncharacterized protein METZ01_LOCUS401833, partial [marine metagenome]